MKHDGAAWNYISVCEQLPTVNRAILSRISGRGDKVSLLYFNTPFISCFTLILMIILNNLLSISSSLKFFD
jgi:hypothetical protein